MRVRLTRLCEEVRIEFAALATMAAEVETHRAALAQPTTASPILSHVAVRLHHWYTALESLLERIARQFDESLPDGPTSHRDLLRQMAAELPSLRPAVLDRT
jgi:hypothetical protein